MSPPCTRQTHCHSSGAAVDRHFIGRLVAGTYPFYQKLAFCHHTRCIFDCLGAGLFRSFSLLGAGLWLALWAGMLGTPDEYKASITLPTHQYVHTSLPFDIRLDTFTVRRYPTGEPMEYTAELSFKESQSPVVTEATLRVNHPVRYKGYRMYLLDYEQTPMGDIVSCTVLVTRQPWSILVLLGILLMMGGAIKQFIK